MKCHGMLKLGFQRDPTLATNTAGSKPNLSELGSRVFIAQISIIILNNTKFVDSSAVILEETFVKSAFLYVTLDLKGSLTI